MEPLRLSVGVRRRCPLFRVFVHFVSCIGIHGGSLVHVFVWKHKVLSVAYHMRLDVFVMYICRHADNLVRKLTVEHRHHP